MEMAGSTLPLVGALHDEKTREKNEEERERRERKREKDELDRGKLNARG